MSASGDLPCACGAWRGVAPHIAAPSSKQLAPHCQTTCLKLDVSNNSTDSKLSNNYEATEGSVCLVDNYTGKLVKSFRPLAQLRKPIRDLDSRPLDPASLPEAAH